MLSRSFSKENSGVCTPTVTTPASRYFSAQARTYGSVRSQLMHVYVRKSTTTTFPRSPSGVSGSEFSHDVAPLNEANSPSTGGWAISWDISPPSVRTYSDMVREDEGSSSIVRAPFGEVGRPSAETVATSSRRLLLHGPSRLRRDDGHG